MLNHPLTNDRFDEAIAISETPFSARTGNARASRQPGEPQGCGNAERTVWYRYEAPRDEGLVANTYGSNHPTALAVYAGRDIDQLTVVGCDSNLRGNSLVAFEATRGTMYFFQVGATTVRGGDLAFNLEQPGRNIPVSVSRSGGYAEAASTSASLSRDGRFVAFQSQARTLDPDVDAHGCLDAPIPDRLLFLTVPVSYLCSNVYISDRESGRIRLVSLSTDGAPANLSSDHPYLSGNGRFVAFRSFATNLVPGDTNGSPDIFVHDLQTGRTERVSVSSSGKQSIPLPTVYGPVTVDQPSISDDGRYVAFVSNAGDLVPSDGNLSADVFVHDRLRHVTERVSIDSAGREQELTIPGTDGLGDRDQQRQSRTELIINGQQGASWFAPSISADGRYVAFRSQASNLVPGDTNRAVDMFLRDRLRNTTERVSVSSTGEEGDDATDTTYEAARPMVSADGRYVLFTSYASNLVPDDTNGMRDAFVRDRLLNRTTRVSVSSSGEEAKNGQFVGDAAISADGRWIVFTSNAEGLAPGNQHDPGSPGVPFAGEGGFFIHDLVRGTTESILYEQLGDPLAGGGKFGFPSADGGVIAYVAACLHPLCGSTGAFSQVFVHERPQRYLP